MQTIKIPLGSKTDLPIQTTNRGGKSNPAYQPSDSFTAQLSRGQGQAVLFNPTVAFYTDGGTQTGYDQGQVLVALAAAQMATLEAGGTYLLEVWWTQQTSCVARLAIFVEASAGTGTQTVVPYCSLQDVLDIAPWVRQIQDSDSDQEGFYAQRKQARDWMDEAILNNYRGAYVGLFETHSTMAFAFGYAGWRRSLGPSPSLVTYLQQNLLLVKPYIVRATAHWAAGLIGLSQIGINPQQAQMGCYHRDTAEREMVAITAEVDLNADGVGELFINLGSTNTLFS
jgi:hypothetical protein